MEQQNIFKEYYQNMSESDVWLPKFSSWRKYKLRLQDDKIIDIPNQIYSRKQLLKYLRKYSPKDVWYSSNLFLNPLNVRSKDRKDEHFPIASNLFLGTKELVLDIDDNNLEEARQKAIKVLDKVKDYEIDRIAFSGKKGFHIILKDDYHPILKVSERREQYKKDREAWIKEHNITEADINPIINALGVIRLPQSLNNNGNVCKNITEDELRTGEFDVIKVVE